MKRFLQLLALIFLSIPMTMGQNKFVLYKGQQKSFIEWNKLNVEDWLDAEVWKMELRRREKNPYWKLKLRDRHYREVMGRILSCIGECRIYRGAGYANASFRSSIKEGDEIKTYGNSYAWVFLMEGTLVRISPYSSISFKEINRGQKENLLSVRINEGYVTWLSRSTSQLEGTELPETDTLFLPLRWFAANAQKKRTQPIEKSLWKYLQDDNLSLKQIKRFNSFLTQNKKIFWHKPTHTFLVLPNGTVSGTGMRVEAFVIMGYESYFKQKSAKSLLLKADPDDTEEVRPLEFYYRGYLNRDVFKVEEETWYKVDAQGKGIEAYPEGEKIFAYQEFLTKRIPTFLLAREMMLKKYSKMFFTKNITENILASRYGYRLWGSLDDELPENDDEYRLPSLGERLLFLKEYVRRTETTNLFSTFTLMKRLHGEILPPSPGYSKKYHHLAFSHYLLKMARGQSGVDERDMRLNSTRQKIWIMHNAAGAQ